MYIVFRFVTSVAQFSGKDFKILKKIEVLQEIGTEAEV